MIYLTLSGHIKLQHRPTIAEYPEEAQKTFQQFLQLAFYPLILFSGIALFPATLENKSQFISPDLCNTFDWFKEDRC